MYNIILQLRMGRITLIDASGGFSFPINLAQSISHCLSLQIKLSISWLCLMKA